MRSGVWEGRTGETDSGGCFRVCGQCAVLMQARAHCGAGVWGSWGGGGGLLGVLFDDLRTVAPGFGLSFGQGQPGWLCRHLWRVTGGEAL